MKKRLISNLLTVTFVALFVWYGFTNQDMLRALDNVAIWGLVLITIGKMFTFVSNGLFTKWTAELFTAKFSLAHSVYITILSAIGNFFGPLLGGASIRAVYLKKYHNLSYSKFTATLMGYYLILFATNAVLAIVSLLFLPHTRQTNYILAFFGLWLCVLVGLTFVRVPRRVQADQAHTKATGYFIKVLREIEEGWRLLVGHKNMLAKLFALGGMNLAATYFISFVEFQALHISVDFAALGLYTAIVATSLLLSITPGAIGIREAMLVLISSTLGITNHQIVQVAIIDRGVHFALLGILFIATRNSKFKKSLTNTSPQSKESE